MKVFALFILMLVLSACGRKNHSSSPAPTIDVTENTLSCDIDQTSKGAPRVKVDREILDLVVRDLSGKTFSVTSFWRDIKPSTRLRLNLDLNKKLKNVAESIVYSGLPLFIENHLKNPGQSFFVKGGQDVVTFTSENGAVVAGDCKDQETLLATVDLSKVIRQSEFEKKLDCYGQRMHVEVSLYRNAVVFTKYFDTYAFVGKELKRKEKKGDIKLVGIADDETTLTASITAGNLLDIRLVGTSGSIIGTGMCH